MVPFSSCTLSSFWEVTLGLHKAPDIDVLGALLQHVVEQKDGSGSVVQYQPAAVSTVLDVRRQ